MNIWMSKKLQRILPEQFTRKERRELCSGSKCDNAPSRKRGIDTNFQSYAAVIVPYDVLIAPTFTSFFIKFANVMLTSSKVILLCVTLLSLMLET